MTNLLNRFERDLLIKGLSDRTIKTYVRCVTAYLNHHNSGIDFKSSAPIKIYLHFLVKKQKVSRYFKQTRN